MEPNPLRDLFSDLARDAEECSAPSLASVLTLVRRERTRRLRRRSLAAAGVLLCGVSLFWMTTESHPSRPGSIDVPVVAPRVATEVSVKETFPVERVSDAELLDLLGRTPAALVELPDGRQRLMLGIATGSRR